MRVKWEYWLDVMHLSEAKSMLGSEHLKLWERGAQST
jgi:hypothetical protein